MPLFSGDELFTAHQKPAIGVVTVIGLNSLKLTLSTYIVPV